MKHALFLICGLTLFMVGCGDSNGPLPGGNEEEDETDTLDYMAGTWLTDCLSIDRATSATIQLTVGGESMTQTVIEYLDRECTAESKRLTQEIQFFVEIVGETDTGALRAKKMNLTTSKFTWTPHDTNLVSEMNDQLEGFCGYTDWAADTAKEITNRNCGGRGYTAGIKHYDIVVVDGDQIFIGDRQHALQPAPLEEASRPSDLSDVLVFIRQAS